MTWADFYLVCFLVGFALSLISLLMGVLDLHIPGLDGGADASPDAGGLDFHAEAGHVNVGHGGAPHGGLHVSPFNFATIMAFLAWFGATGFLLTRFGKLVSLLALGIATVGGLVGASIVFWFLAKVFMKHDYTLKASDYDIVGVLGRLTVGIREGGTGEIVFSQAGTRHTAGARSDDGTAIPTNVEVVVTGYEDGIAYVRPWAEMTGEQHRVASRGLGEGG
jgi:hypothetical protein